MEVTPTADMVRRYPGLIVGIKTLILRTCWAGRGAVEAEL